jgi:hypothetical protein
VADRTAEPEKAEDKFVEELKESYEKELDLKSKLDTKSNTMVSISGTVAALIMGFGSFLIRDIPLSKLEIIIPTTIILLVEITLIVITIKYSISAYKLREYYYPVSHKEFFDAKGDFKEEIIDTEYLLIKEYLKSIN